MLLTLELNLIIRNQHYLSYSKTMRRATLQISDEELLEICKQQKEYEIREEDSFLDFIPIGCIESDERKERMRKESENGREDKCFVQEFDITW